MTFTFFVLGCVLGAPARYLVSRALNHLRGFPWGTLAVNVGGAAVLGFVVSDAGTQPAGLREAVIGFCGTFTTYAAFALETAELGKVRGLLYVVTTVVLGVAAATLGWGLG